MKTRFTNTQIVQILKEAKSRSGGAEHVPQAHRHRAGVLRVKGAKYGSIGCQRGQALRRMGVQEETHLIGPKT